MKVQSTFYPDFISKTVDLPKISSLITKKAQIIAFRCIYVVNSQEKMSQITHFCGVKFLAWKYGTVKFSTNIMSDMISFSFYCGLNFCKSHISTQKSLDMSTRPVGFVNALYSTLRHHWTTQAWFFSPCKLSFSIWVELYSSCICLLFSFTSSAYQP